MPKSLTFYATSGVWMHQRFYKFGSNFVLTFMGSSTFNKGRTIKWGYKPSCKWWQTIKSFMQPMWMDKMHSRGLSFFLLGFGFIGNGGDLGFFWGLFPLCSHRDWNLFPSGSRSSHCVPNVIPEVLNVFPTWFPKFSLCSQCGSLTLAFCCVN
jgi:hypothetical protein